MTYAEKPDYARCVSIVATSALKVGSWGTIMQATCTDAVKILFSHCYCP